MSRQSGGEAFIILKRMWRGGGEGVVASVCECRNGEVCCGVGWDPGGLPGAAGLHRLYTDQSTFIQNLVKQLLPAQAYRSNPRAFTSTHTRYGFHGSSYKYLVPRAAKTLGKPVESLNAIICHLGMQRGEKGAPGGGG